MKPTTPSSSPEARALRVGLLHDGKLVTERVVPVGVSVTVGTSPRNTLRIPDAAVPWRHVLFAPRPEGPVLRWTPTMSGRVASGDQSQALGAGGGALALDANSRGKIEIGPWVVLFQQIPAPLASARSPRSMQGLNLEEGDREFIGFLGGFAALATLLMVAVARAPMPTEVDITDVSGRIIELVRVAPDLPVPKVLTKVMQAVTHRPAPAANAPTVTHTVRPAVERTHDQLVAEVMARSAMFQVMGTHGDSPREDGVPDIFNPANAEEQHLKELLSGVSYADKGPGGATLHGPTAPDGRIDKGIGELGRGGGGTTVVGHGPETSFHAPGKKDIETVGGDPAGNDQVRSQVTQFARAVQACYEQELRRDPSLSGRLVMELHVQAGRVSSVDVGENTTGNSELEVCAQHRIQSWRFDPSVTVDLSVPFTLSGS